MSAPPPRPNLYAQETIDRQADLRRAPDRLAARLATEGGALLVLKDGAVPVRQEAAGPRLALLETRAAGDPAATVLLGEWQGRLWLARAADTPPAGADFVDLRQVGAQLPAGEAALAAQARALLWWHRRHRFCGLCGAPTLVREAGHVRLCSDPGCGASHFPRTDPAVIVLVEDGDRVLLGRQHQWPQGLYSVLAGFLEPGESLEQTVAREVMEESGIAVTDIRYHSSQPWPFPQSLMLGFLARAASRDIAFDTEELQDCRWFDRETLVAMRAAGTPGDGRLVLPRQDSIARRLLEDWLDRRTDCRN